MVAAEITTVIARCGDRRLSTGCVMIGPSLMRCEIGIRIATTREDRDWFLRFGADAALSTPGRIHACAMEPAVASLVIAPVATTRFACTHQ